MITLASASLAGRLELHCHFPNLTPAAFAIFHLEHTMSALESGLETRPEAQAPAMTFTRPLDPIEILPTGTGSCRN